MKTDLPCAMSSTISKRSKVFESETIVIDNDGGWCWFESSRALQLGSILLIGSVASGGNDIIRRGNIELHVYNCTSKSSARVILKENFELDDHDSPALLLRPDGRLLAVFAKHGTESKNYLRLSSPNHNEFDKFDPIQTFEPSSTTELTYANLYMLPAESNRIYNFFRGLHGSYKPSYIYSDDLGATWHTGNIFIDVPSTEKHRPYIRYASNGFDTVHMVYTEAHPRDFDNSLYHIYYRNGYLHRSDGTKLSSLENGLKTPEQGTRIYPGDSQHVAWIIDVVLDKDGHPVCIYSVQYDSASLPIGQGGEDIRYRYARWNEDQWHDYSLAFAGCRLYSGEDDYSGLAAIEPDDPSSVYISTNSDPSTGQPLISEKDHQRHYEIFHGKTEDYGKTWNWEAITENSTIDNLRPVRTQSVKSTEPKEYRALVWLRGKYLAYTDYMQAIVARIWTLDNED